MVSSLDPDELILGVFSARTSGLCQRGQRHLQAQRFLIPAHAPR
jgi:hypothetical protein